MACPAKPDSTSSWKPLTVAGKTLFDGGAERTLDGVTPFSSHLVAYGREGGIPRVWVAGFQKSTSSDVAKFARVEFEEDA